MNAPARIPSPAYREAQRVQRAALRALRSGMRSRLFARDLAELAGCEVLGARNALMTLQAQRMLTSKLEGANETRRYFELTQLGRETSEA
jgi:hypothetical protein